MDENQQQYQDDYNNLGIRTNPDIPFDLSPQLNNAGVKNVIGTSEDQTVQTPVSPSGNIQNSGNVGYNIGTGWWIGIDPKDGKPKFFLGKDTGNKITWDGSTLGIVGAISASSIDIPDTTTANSFHTDVNGNSWWGATTFNAAPAKISNAGVATFTGLSIINTFTAGENLTAGKLLCFKNTFAAWGDNASADRNTTGVCTKMVYVDANNPTTNYQGTKSLCFVGVNAGGGPYQTLLTLDTTMLPSWSELDTIYLRLYVVFSNAGMNGVFTLSVNTADWNEATVTWNTKPTNSGLADATGTVVVESYSNENNASAADGTATGYIDFDITESYRLISQSGTNYGYTLASTVSAGAGINVRFGGMTRAGGGTFNQAPFVVSYITKDNPGSGNTIVANDGKVYLASNANYQRVKQLAGISGASANAGGSVSVYGLADGSLVPSSVLTVVNNQDYFLNNTNGTIGVLTNNILESNKWDLHVGVGSPSGLIIDKDKKPLFIRSNSFATCLPPPNCSMVKLVWDNSANVEGSGQLELVKGFLTSVTGAYKNGTTVSSVSLSWASGTSGTISYTASGFTGTPTHTFYFYK